MPDAPPTIVCGLSHCWRDGRHVYAQGWVIAPGKLALQVGFKERGELVLGGAWATFRD